MKILVVDDEPKIRELIGQYLTVAGYETEFAKDGIEALNIVTKGDIDLVILDVMMPFMQKVRNTIKSQVLKQAQMTMW